MDQFGPLPPDMDGYKYGNMFIHCPSSCGYLLLATSSGRAERFLKQFLIDKPGQMEVDTIHTDSSTILMTPEWREVCLQHNLQSRHLSGIMR
jgi:hypothetical protein